MDHNEFFYILGVIILFPFIFCLIMGWFFFVVCFFMAAIERLLERK